jgi:hypothetical protein
MDMQSFHSVMNEVNALVQELLKTTSRVAASRVGLDVRCGTLTIGDNFIAVPKHSDRLLQYYGGFEYVDKDARQELGDWVFYTLDDDRVVDAYYEAQEYIA